MATWTRPLTSVAAALLLLAASFAAPVPPDVGKPTRAMAAWAADHAGALRWQAWLVMVALVPTALVAGWVYHRLTGPEAAVYLIGIITASGVLAVLAMVRLGLARAAEQGSDTGALGLMGAYWAPVDTLPVAVGALALALAARRGSLPMWLGSISAVLCVEQLVESGSMFGTTGLFGPGGTLNSWVGPTLYVIWLVGQGFAVREPQDRPS